MYVYKVAEILGDLDFGESNEEDRDRTYGHNSKSVFLSKHCVYMNHMHLHMRRVRLISLHDHQLTYKKQLPAKAKNLLVLFIIVDVYMVGKLEIKF